MEIEMIVPALPLAGMELVVASLTRGLARRGHNVGVTCIQTLGPVADALQQDGYRVTLASSPGLRTILNPVRLRRWLKVRRPDVVHVHSGAWLKSTRAALMAGVPRIVYTLHGLDGTPPWSSRVFDRWAARGTHAAVAVSAAFLPYLRDQLGIQASKLHVIINGIDVGMFAPGPRSGRIRSLFGLQEDDLVVGHVARFSPVKNHAVLVGAFARVLQTHPRAFLALVGDGPLRSDIENRVDRLGIRSRVGFAGLLGDLPDVYRDFDLLVLPSLTEATSMSILEAMATGLPVVATEVGGTPELLDQGAAGILVPSNDAAALADALSRLMAAPPERKRLGRLARQRAEMLYTESRMIDDYEVLYHLQQQPVHG